MMYMPTMLELAAIEGLYRSFRRFLFRRTADEAHQLVIRRMEALDDRPGLCRVMDGFRRRSVLPTQVGRLGLDSPLILGAGLVKGVGFATQEAALRSAAQGRNIIPGWRSVPAMLGPVEMGSFTPRPRLGNPGRVLWRDTDGMSLLNNVGLRNPGAAAAALFLAERSEELPGVFGISMASDPDQVDPGRRDHDVAAAVRLFTESGVRPSWMTVNISCPNVPEGYGHAQLPEEVYRLCGSVRGELAPETVLWVKVSPDMGSGRYAQVAQAAVEGGAEGIVATNTAPGRISSGGPKGGVGGAALHPYALAVTSELDMARRELGLDFEIVGCGGVLDGKTFKNYIDRGAAAVQYWSALVFRGPTAPALIVAESKKLT